MQSVSPPDPGTTPDNRSLTDLYRAIGDTDDPNSFSVFHRRLHSVADLYNQATNRKHADGRSYFQKVADLEKNDPEIRQLSDQLSRAIDHGADSECQENIAFNAAVDGRLGVPTDSDWVTLPTPREGDGRAR